MNYVLPLFAPVAMTLLCLVFMAPALAYAYLTWRFYR